jgi:hypothetical protein
MIATREFADLSGERQVLRALRGLVHDGRLVRLGYGVYARAIMSRLSDRSLLMHPTGLQDAAREALTKLGVKWEPTEAERAYNEGRSTQIPVNPLLRRFCAGHGVGEAPDFETAMGTLKNLAVPLT